MKESHFVEQNNQKWEEFEIDHKGESKDPIKKSRLFIQITDDLSYARTFYGNRSVREYLNGIGQLLFSQLNLNERFTFKKFILFFTNVFPKAMFATRRSMLVSLIVFALSFTIGVLTTMQDPEFANEILGSSYISMTEQNIANDDPMAVYKSTGEFEMFVKIAFNNLRVAYITFLFGVLSSIGSFLVIIYNGVMVGVFQYFFIEKGLFWTSFLTIWTHGTIEIACIIVAGGAGLQLGKGLLFPGTYSRIEAFKMSGKSALIVITGITPLIIAAAFIEGFQTRHTEINDYAKLGFILFCLAFVLFYFFWYPRIKFANGKDAFSEFEQDPVNSSTETFDTKEIYNVFKLFSFVLGYCVKHTKVVVLSIMGVCGLFTLTMVLLPEGTFLDPMSADFQSFKISSMFNYDEFYLMAIPVLLSIWIVMSVVSLHFKKMYRNNFTFTFSNVLLTLVSTLISTVLIMGIASVSTWWSTILVFIATPLIIFITAIGNLDDGSSIKTPKLIIPKFNDGRLSSERLPILYGPILFRHYIKNNFGNFLALNFLIVILIYSFYLVSNQLIIPTVAPALSMLFTDSYENQNILQFAIKIFFTTIVPFGLALFYSISCHYMYFSVKESNTAEHLFERIKKLIPES